MEMREGNLKKQILIYSLPLMFTNLLQVFFNVADVAVVGKFSGAIALGAVGSTTILVTLTTGWLMGISNGVNALTARFIGAADEDSEHRAVHTGFILCLGIGLLVLVLGLLLASPVLALLKTKDELIEQAVVYFKIYMLGSPALAIYNYGNAILSASGETRKPLKYLSIAGVLNILLNLLFVIVFKMSAAGVAVASVISQYVSALLIMKELLTTGEQYRLSLKDLSFDKGIAARVLAIGVPTAIQYSLFAVANLFVQSAVNSFDHVTVEGNSAAANADPLVYDMMAAFYTACTSFIAQNFGAKNKKRVLHAYLVSTAYSFGTGLLLGLLLFAFKSPFLYIFTDSAEVVSRGSERLAVMSLAYCISAFMDNATAAARGLGKTVIPTIIVILGTVVFRIVWIYTLFAHFHTITALYLLYPCAWFITAVFGNIYFFREYRKI